MKDKIYLKNRWVGGYNNTSGIFGKDRGIFVEYKLSKINNPSLIFHEVGHYFYFGSAPNAWLDEGIVSFLPLVLYKKNILKLSRKEAETILRHWGFDNIKSKGDLPVVNDFRKKKPELFRFWYKKTFKIQFILIKELGAKNYQKFLTEIIKNRVKYKTYNTVVGLLKKLKNKNWNKLLSGWVTGGKYFKYKWLYFKNKNIKDILAIK
jgi:hypothetical protein